MDSQYGGFDGLPFSDDTVEGMYSILHVVKLDW